MTPSSSAGDRGPPQTPAFRAGLVGAGSISEHHLGALEALPRVELVGLYDHDENRASARAEEWSTTAFQSLPELVAAGANVIHVLTPPAAHAEIALEALGLDCHVLVEKPLAESATEARSIGTAAADRGLVATVSHSLLYDPQVQSALERVRMGAVGDVIGVDIFRSQEYPPYEGGPLPPHMRQAAFPWRDVGIHCLYLIRELLGEIANIDAEWLSLGGDPNLAFDEWRGLVRCENGLGQFQLSWNQRPAESQVLIRGTEGVLRVDLFAMFRTKRSPLPVPKAVERVLNAYAESLRPAAEVPVSAWRFLRKDIRPFQGVRNLIADFYHRLEAGMPPRVDIAEAATLVGWLDEVARGAEAEQAERASRFLPLNKKKFLVTGASGSLGSAVVNRLLADGHGVRALVRRIPAKPLDRVEYALGNLGDPNAVDRAMKDIAVVVHAGAAMSGSWAEHRGSTVVGTGNVVDACRRGGISQLIHISSLSVLDWQAAGGTAGLDESAPLEPRPERRGEYTRAKLEAELTVLAGAAEGLPCVVLRPGAIFGGGAPLMTPAVARGVGRYWLVLGTGRLTVPLIYIDDVVDAIVAAVDAGLTSGEVLHIVDAEQLTQREVLAATGARPAIRIPLSLLLAVGGASELMLRAFGRPSPLSPYRLRSALADVRFRSDRVTALLDWRPRIGVREGIRRVSSEQRAP